MVVVLYQYRKMADESKHLLLNDDESNKSSDLQGAARWWDFVKEFFILSFVSFGGPQSHIAVLRHDVVETRKWFSPQRFAEVRFGTVCNSRYGY